MTASEVRALVKDALSPHVGRYVTSDGTQVPAVNVGEKLPAGFRMDPTFKRHLEAVIQPSPELTPAGLFGGNLVERRWRVIVKDWGPVIAPTVDAAGVATACEELIARLEVVSCVIVPATAETLERGTCLVRDFGTAYTA